MTKNASINPPSHRSVLMVACAFPPTGGSGVQRTSKFAKYLPDHGWLPVVWSRDRVPGLPMDERLGADLPNSVVVQSTPGNFWDALWESAGRIAERGGILAPFARRMSQSLGRSLPYRRLPDDQIAWARRSVRPVERILHAQNIRAIYSTLSPASNHWLALELKRRTGLPWIADFRDLWTDDYRYQESSAFRRSAHQRLEKDVLETADAVIGVSRRQTEILASHAPSRRDRFVTITNGFDPEDFKGMTKPGPHTVNSADQDPVFVLAHIGRLDRWRACEPLFEALADFVRSLGADRKPFRLQFVGHADVGAKERLLTDRVPYRHVGYLDHAEAIRSMASADALLLAVPDGPNADSVIPAKLFEYLASHKPILCVGPSGGEAEQIVHHCRAGVNAGFDRAEILSALCALYDDWRDGATSTACQSKTLIPFRRTTLAARLARVLDSVADGNLDRLRELAVDPGYPTNQTPLSQSPRVRATPSSKADYSKPEVAEAGV